MKALKYYSEGELKTSLEVMPFAKLEVVQFMAIDQNGEKLRVHLSHDDVAHLRDQLIDFKEEIAPVKND